MTHAAQICSGYAASAAAMLTRSRFVRAGAAPRGAGFEVRPAFTALGEATIDEAIRIVALERLAAHGWHRERAASSLGVGVRTLGMWLRQWRAAGHAVPGPWRKEGT